MNSITDKRFSFGTESDFGTNPEPFLQTHTILPSKNYSQHLLHVLAGNTLTPAYTTEEQRSVSAPADVTTKHFDTTPSSKCPSIENVKWIHPNNQTTYNGAIAYVSQSLEMNKGDKHEMIPEASSKIIPTQATIGVEGESPFSELINSETINDNVSINELVVMEYKTQQKTTID